MKTYNWYLSRIHLYSRTTLYRLH